MWTTIIIIFLISTSMYIFYEIRRETIMRRKTIEYLEEILKKSGKI